MARNARQLPRMAVLGAALLACSLALGQDGNLPPAFGSAPVADAFQGMEYRYVVAASDANGDPVAFSAVIARSDQSNVNGTPSVLAYKEGWQSFTVGKTGFLR